MKDSTTTTALALPGHRVVRGMMIPLLALLLSGCWKSVPPEKSAYVGEWREKTVSLGIMQNGMVRYERFRDGKTTTFAGPIRKFDGDDFEAGIGSLSTTFKVGKPPYQDGETWKMVVDGVELTRRPPLPTAETDLSSGKGKPLPPEKAAYAGEWREKDMHLLIAQDGSVAYERKKGSETTSINGPIIGFSGDNFEVGFPPMISTFFVGKPPYQEGEAWKMEVDGVTLTRQPDRAGQAER